MSQESNRWGILTDLDDREIEGQRWFETEGLKAGRPVPSRSKSSFTSDTLIHRSRNTVSFVRDWHRWLGKWNQFSLENKNKNDHPRFYVSEMDKKSSNHSRSRSNLCPWHSRNEMTPTVRLQIETLNRD